MNNENLTLKKSFKNFQYLKAEYYKILKNKFKKTNKSKDTPCSWILCFWIERLSAVKMSIHLNFVYGFNIIPLEITADCFLFCFSGIINKLILKFM